MKLPICKGDVYTFVPNAELAAAVKRTGMAGPLLECAARNAYLAFWMAKSKEANWAELLELGYWEISGPKGEGKTSGTRTVGYFIPSMINKAEVAEDIRKKFGRTAALLKPNSMRHVPDYKTAYLSHIKAKNRAAKPEFVQDLVNECAETFVKLSGTDSLQDAYFMIRTRLQIAHGVTAI